MEPFYGHDKSFFTYKGFCNYQFMICNNNIFVIYFDQFYVYKWSNISFENILINDQQSKVLLVVKCGKIAFVIS